MVPLSCYSTVAGIPITELIDANRIAELDKAAASVEELKGVLAKLG